MSKWRYMGFSVYGDKFLINSLDVWKHEWAHVLEPPAEVVAPPGVAYPPPAAENLRVMVKDPRGQEHRFDVFEVSDGRHRAVFAAGEVAYLVYAFWVCKGDPAP